MKLFFYEARKTYIRKYIVIFLIFLTFVDIFKISLDYKEGKIDALMAESEENQKAVKTIYNNIRVCSAKERAKYIDEEEQRLGEIYHKRLNKEKKGEKTYSGNLYEDYRLLEMYIAGQYHYMNEYAEYSRDIESLAQDNVTYYENVNNTSQKKVNQYIVEKYKNRSINDYYRMNTAQSFFDYNFSAVLILILSLLAFSPVFGMEYESGMQDILLTSKKTRKNLMMKLLGAVCFCVCIVTWFFMVDYLSFRFICGIEGLNMPIWSIQEMKNSFLNCNVAYFILIKYGTEILGFLTIMLILLFLSSILKKPVYIMLVFAPVVIFSYQLSGLINSVSPIEKVASVCNPISLLSAKSLYEKFYFVEWRDSFILASDLCIWANIIISIVLIIAIIFMQRRKCLK